MLTKHVTIENILLTTIKGHHVADRLQFSAAGRGVYTLCVNAETENEIAIAINKLCDSIIEFYGLTVFMRNGMRSLRL